MAIYRVVRKAKDGASIGVGTLRTRWGRPVELVINVPAMGAFQVEQLGDDDEVTVPGERPPSEVLDPAVRPAR